MPKLFLTKQPIQKDKKKFDLGNTNALVSSKHWLSLYGLKSQKLEFAHILSSIGFKNSDDFISILKKPVSSRYASGLFRKVAHKDGTYYNIIGSREKLKKAEHKLQVAVDAYKKRLEWLTSSSRRLFGVIEEKRICIVIDLQEKSESRFQFCIQVLKSLVKEQISEVEKFNLIRASTEHESWQHHCASVSSDSCNDAIQWLQDLQNETEYSSTCVLESILEAASDTLVDAIYIYSDGTLCKTGADILLDKIKVIEKPIHVVCTKVKSYPNVQVLKKIAESASGRFHFFNNEEEKDMRQSRSPSPDKNIQGLGVRPDVMLIWEELDQARTTLFDVQSILEDLDTASMNANGGSVGFEKNNNHQSSSPKKTDSSSKPPPSSSKQLTKTVETSEFSSINEFSMSSKQWLKKHGLKKLNLTVFSFLNGSVFAHCDGVLSTKHPTEFQSTWVDARYCSKFAHLKWHDGSVKHVHLTDTTFRRYKERLMLMLDKYNQRKRELHKTLTSKIRLNWLQKGSRELFGTIIEDRVVFLIDTSSSMSTRLKIVKEKLLQLLQEQLHSKEKFNFIHFDSEVEAWKDHLVSCTSKEKGTSQDVDVKNQNLDSAWTWVKTLQANGSTNTLRALQMAYSMNGLQAIYLLTDGRPDQRPEQILSHIDASIPVHCISFNCDDSEANRFLYELAGKTDGRYHYFSEDISVNADTPTPYQSDDLSLLKKEIERGLSDLQTMSKLQYECRQIELAQKERQMKKLSGRTTKPYSHIEHKARPFSASGYMTNRASELRMKPQRPASSKPKHISSRLPPASSTRPISNNSTLVKRPLSTTESSFASDASSTKRLKNRRKKKKRVKSEIKRWLQENGIAAQKLTILDALGPTLVHAKTHYVPALGKDVVSKVYGEASPIIHLSETGRAYQIINPQAIDLVWYEEKLMDCLKLIEAKLDNFAFSIISEELRNRKKELQKTLTSKISFGNDYSLPAPSFKLNKTEIYADIEEQNLTAVLKDVKTLENELDQGNTYLKQSEELRTMIKELAEEKKQQASLLKEEEEKKLPRKPSPIKKPHVDDRNLTSNGRVRYHRVIARSDLDGFYHPAIVNKYVNVRYVSLRFDNGENQLTSVRYVISIGGSTACPTLNVGDYVLVKVNKKFTKDEDDDDDDNDDDEESFSYVPGIVQVTPLKMKSASKCYTIIKYNGTKVTSIRRDLIKITRSRFVFTTRFIHEVHTENKKSFDALIKHDNRRGKKRKLSERLRQSSDSSHQDSQSSDDNSSIKSHPSSSLESSLNRQTIPKIITHPPSNDPSEISDTRENKSTRSEKDHSEPKHERNISLEDQRNDKDENSSSDSGSESDNEDRKNSPKRNSSSSGSDSGTDDGQHKTENEERKTEDEADDLPTEKDIEDVENSKKENEMNEKFEEWRKSLEEQHELRMQELSEEKQLLHDLQERLKFNEEQQQQKQVLLEKQQEMLQQQQQDFLQQRIQQQNDEQQTLKVTIAPFHRKRMLSKDVGVKIQERYNDLTSLQQDIFKRQEEHQQELMKHIVLKQQEMALHQKNIQQAIHTKDQETQLTPRQELQETPRSHSPYERNAYSTTPPPPPPLSHNDIIQNQSNLSDDEDDEPKVQVYVDPSNEALLMAHGESGILLSRYPPDVDPAIEVRKVPAILRLNQEVLARFKDDGWYYRGTLVKAISDNDYVIQDSVGDLEQFIRDEIITDDDDADNVITIGDFVVALHPRFTYAYAPGIVRGVETDGAMMIQFYDGQTSAVPRAECYFISPLKYERDCLYIRQCEDALVGQAVVCRDNKTGFYHLAAVRERVAGSRNYLVEWADQKIDMQNYAHIFGAHTKRPKFEQNCHVLAIADSDEMAYLPGAVAEIDSSPALQVLFFNNAESMVRVDVTQAFWISPDFYHGAVKYIEEMKLT